MPASARSQRAACRHPDDRTTNRVHVGICRLGDAVRRARHHLAANVPRGTPEPRRDLMEIAAVSTVLAMAGPLGWDRWSDFFQDDAPGLGYLALIASAGFMVIAVRQARALTASPLPRVRVRPHRQRKRRMPRMRPVGGDATYSVIVVKATSSGSGTLRRTSSASCTRRRGCGASPRTCPR